MGKRRAKKMDAEDLKDKKKGKYSKKEEAKETKTKPKKGLKPFSFKGKGKKK